MGLVDVCTILIEKSEVKGRREGGPVTFDLTKWGWQRTKRSVYSVTMHVHARALVQRTSHSMWRTSQHARCVAILAKAASAFRGHVAHVTHARCVAILVKAPSAVCGSRHPAQNGYGEAWLALLLCSTGCRCTYQR